MALKSGNPALSVKTFEGLGESSDPMTLSGTVNKAAMLLGHPIAFIHESGALGVAFSLFVVGIAALNLVMDFDFIANGIANRNPKYMEWYSAFGLVVTLVWLYIEILRLLGKRR